MDSMEYMTCTEAHSIWGITARRIQQLCQNGSIEGAIKKGRTWLIPADAVCPAPEKKSTAGMTGPAKKRPLPIGVSNYIKATTEYYYVDKTLLIRDFLDTKAEVTLFTRPRRFGKTLNMDMLRVFFEKKENDNADNSVYFKDKLIWQCGEEYTSYQGKYPVIYLSFKDVKCDTWEMTLDMLGKLITLEFLRHSELESSDRLSIYEKNIYKKFAGGTANEIDYQLSLQYLSIMLNRHYGEKTVIIIDEYDTPIQQGHNSGFYTQIIGFMRGFFSGGLKDDSHLAYGFLTGILRIARESIFSGLNNIKICSVLDDDYSQYFGFTLAEVKKMLAYYGVPQKIREVCEWYDGYLFGHTEIFNPWSVVNFIAEKCEAKAFWQSTGSNECIGEIISSASPEIMESLHRLLSGGSVTTAIDTNVIYPEISKNPYSIYSFLLVAGYLKAAKVLQDDMNGNIYDVSVPNREISLVYEKEILDRFHYGSVAVSVQQAIYAGDAVKLQNVLESFLLNCISFYDTANEGFYHGLLLGLCAVLSNRYQIQSNREAGYGRFDIQLMPENRAVPGFIFELKHARSENEDLNALAAEALEQIERKKYTEQMRSAGVSEIIRIGIAFYGKKVAVRRS